MAGGVVPEPLTHARAEALAEVLPDLITAAQAVEEAVGVWLDVAPDPPAVVEASRAASVIAYESAMLDLSQAMHQTTAMLWR